MSLGSLLLERIQGEHMYRRKGCKSLSLGGFSNLHRGLPMDTGRGSPHARHVRLTLRARTNVTGAKRDAMVDGVEARHIEEEGWNVKYAKLVSGDSVGPVGGAGV